MSALTYPCEPNLLFREDFISPSSMVDNGAILTPGALSWCRQGMVISDDSSTQGLVQYRSAPSINVAKSMSYTMVLDFTPAYDGLAGVYNVLWHWGANTSGKGIMMGLLSKALFCNDWGDAPVSCGAVVAGVRYRFVASYNVVAQVQANYLNAGTPTNAGFNTTTKPQNGLMSFCGTTAAQLRGMRGIYHQARLYSTAWSAKEVIDDYARNTYRELAP